MEPDAADRAFGQAVRRRRMALGLTHEGLAERAGVTREYVGRVERVVLSPSLHSARAFAAALETTLADLLTEGS